MDKIFVVKNQHNLYLSKQQEWVDGADNQILFRTPHRDEAINTVFEVSSRDIYLRAETLACARDAKGNPVVAVGDQQPLPIEAAAESNTGAGIDTEAGFDGEAQAGADNDADTNADTEGEPAAELEAAATDSGEPAADNAAPDAAGEDRAAAH